MRSPEQILMDLIAAVDGDRVIQFDEADLHTTKVLAVEVPLEVLSEALPVGLGGGRS
jgi:hypothetical protein